MKNIKKRILALWMAVCMALTMMPSMAMPVFAAPITGNTNEDATLISKIELVKGEGSGTEITGWKDNTSPTISGIDGAKAWMTENATEIKNFELENVNLKVTGVADKTNVSVKYYVNTADPSTEGDFSSNTFGAGTISESEGSVEADLKTLGMSSASQTIYILADESSTKEIYKINLSGIKAAERPTKIADASITFGAEDGTVTCLPAHGGTLEAAVCETSPAVTISSKLADTWDINVTTAENIKTDLSGVTCGDFQAIGDVKLTKSENSKYIVVIEEKDGKVVGAGSKEITGITYAEKLAAPEFESNDVVAKDDTNKGAEFVVTNKEEVVWPEGVTVNVTDADDAGAAANVTDKQYASESGKVTLTMSSAITKTTTYNISFKDSEDKKNESDKVKVSVQPLTKKPTISTNTVNALEGNTKAEFTVSDDTDLGEETTVAVYTDAEKSAVASGVTGTYSNSDHKLTLTGLSVKDQAKYYVAFTKEPGWAECEDTIEVIVKHVDTTAKPVMKEATANADNTKRKAEYTVLNKVDYAENVTVEVYNESGTGKATGISGTYAPGKLELNNTAYWDAAASYQIAFKEGDNKYESEKVKLTVNPYVKDSKAAISDVKGMTEDSKSFNGAEVAYAKDGTSVANAINIEITADDSVGSDKINKVTFTAPATAKVTQKASDEKLSTNEEFSGTDVADESGSRTIESLNFDDNPYLYVKSVSEDESRTLYYVITVNQLNIKPGTAESSADIKDADLKNNETDLKGKTVVDTSSEDVLKATVVDAVADNAKVADYMRKEGTHASSNAKDGTVWGLLKEKNSNILDGTITYFYVPELKIEVPSNGYDASAKTMVLEITPMYKVIASTQSTYGSVKCEDEDASQINGVVLDEQKLDLHDVTIKIYVPTAIGDNNAKVYVQHESDGYQLATVEDNAVEVDVKSFSQFDIKGEVEEKALLNGKFYATVQDAINALTEDGQTITLTDKAEKTDVQNLKPPTSGISSFEIAQGASSVTVDNDVQFKDKVVGAYTYKVGNSGKPSEGTVTVTRKKDESVEEPESPTEPSGPSGSGGEVTPPVTGGTVTVPSLTNGSVSISDTNAKAGDTVKVTPKANEGYELDKVTVTDKNGKEIEVTDNGDGTYSFVMPAEDAQPVTVNATFKQSSVTPSGDDTIKFKSEKQQEALQNRTTTSKDCALKLEAIDGADIGDLSDWTITSDNPKVVKVLKNNKLRYKDLGTANITVVAKDKDGKEYTITFPVNVTKLGTPTFTLSHISSNKARTFTVTTSTVRGADGFQVKYSLKKSLKSNKHPRFECGKKLNRKTITANKSGRTYYVRVRAYKMVDGERVTSDWSKLTKKIVSK